MFTCSTPASIDLVIDLRVGDIEVIASGRADTVVTVSARKRRQGCVPVDRRDWARSRLVPGYGNLNGRSFSPALPGCSPRAMEDGHG